MTRRQQLILFVLGLATVSTCTVAFAMAMSLGRQMAVSASAADRLSAAELGAERGLAWQMPATSAPQSAVPAEQGGSVGAPQSEMAPASKSLATPTNTRVPTWTPSPTDTPTATRVPTDTPVPTATRTPLPPPPEEVPPPAPTPSTPELTPTLTPEFPFDTMLLVFDTGAPQMTRVTGMVWRIIDVNQGLYDGEAGYQMRLVDPNGGLHLSDVSGIGGADSTCPDCGDNQRMNMKIEIPPYVPGTYRVTLVLGEEQVSPEVEFTLAANPQQYVHINFFPLE